MLEICIWSLHICYLVFRKRDYWSPVLQSSF